MPVFPQDVPPVERRRLPVEEVPQDRRQDAVHQSRDVRQNQDELRPGHRIQDDHRGRQGLPVRQGMCASDASDVARPEAAAHGFQARRPVLPDAAAQRWDGCAGVPQVRVQVLCR